MWWPAPVNVLADTGCNQGRLPKVCREMGTGASLQQLWQLLRPAQNIQCHAALCEHSWAGRCFRETRGTSHQMLLRCQPSEQAGGLVSARQLDPWLRHGHSLPAPNPTVSPTPTTYCPCACAGAKPHSCICCTCGYLYICRCMYVSIGPRVHVYIYIYMYNYSLI